MTSFRNPVAFVHALALGASVIGLTSLGCSSAPRPDPDGRSLAGVVRADGADDALRLGSWRARFSSSIAGRRLLAPAPTGVRFDRRGGTFSRSTRALEVVLPTHADGPVLLREPRSAVEIEVTLEGASAAEARPVDGLTVYRAAFEGADVVHRTHAHGDEDVLTFAGPPRGEEVRYRVRPGGVAALRLVAGALEFLDRGGAPRVRVSPPYLVDASGTRHDASLAVEGCAYDTDPRPPWGRAMPSPGEGPCVVRVSWAGRGVAYPALLDPAWTDGASMVVARQGHSATVMGDGRVLVAGGFDDGNAFASAELYDPASDSWAMAPPMTGARRNHSAVLLGDGSVMVVAGLNEGGATMSSESYGGGAFWTKPIRLQYDHTSYDTVTLDDGTVLATGGAEGLAYPERFVDEAWKLTSSPLLVHEHGTTASLLGTGEVLVVGGETLAAEYYSPAADTWTLTGPLANLHNGHEAATVGGARVMVAGGLQSGNKTPGGGDVKASPPEVYDRATNAWSSAGQPVMSRLNHTVTVVPAGVLIVGGSPVSSIDPYVYSELFLGQSFIAAGSTPHGRRTYHRTVVLGDGRAMVIGGFVDAGDGAVTSSSTEFFAPQAQGAACAADGECTSTHCADGICCDQACSDACVACSREKKGNGEDGTCGPTPAGPASKAGGCAVTAAASCGTSGQCDGKGGCALYDATTSCDVDSCSAGVETVSRCSGAGACEKSSSSCAPYRCDTEGGACTSSCQIDDDCGEDARCEVGSCRAKSRAGVLCQTDETCATGHCVDGVCCDTACGGQCEACDASGNEGTCVPIKGIPHGAREACAAGGEGEPCAAASCDGGETARCAAFAGAEVACREAGCAGGVETFAATCDGARRCQDAQHKTCEPYACGETACMTSCETPDDCAAGFSCITHRCVSGASCDGAHTVTSPTGATTDCSPYGCEGSACKTQCSSIDDCMAPAICDTAGKCVAIPEADDEGASGCALGRLPARPAAIEALALGALVAALGRVRARRAAA